MGEAISRDESALRRLLEQVRIGVYRSTFDGRLLEANRLVLEDLGFGSLEEARAHDLSSTYVDPAERARLLEALRTHGRVRDMELRLRRTTGEEFWCSVTAVASEAEDGTQVIDGLLQEVTERREAERTLRDTSLRLKTLIDQLPGAVWTTDADLRVTSSEGAGLPEIGLRPGQLVGVDLHEWLANDPDGAEGLAAHLRALAGETVEYTSEPFHGRRFRSHLEPLRDAEGRITGTFGVAYDITDMLEARRGAEEAGERLELILEQVPALLWTTDRELRFTSSRGAGLRTLGLEPGQVVGMTVAEYFGVADESFPSLAAHLAAVRNGEATTYEQEWSGRVFQTRVEPLRDTQGQIVGALGVAHDVTEMKLARHRAEEHAHRTAAELEERTAELDAVAYSVSHDVRTPLWAIQGFAETLREECHHLLDENGKACLSRIVAASQRMEEMLKELLVYSRLSRLEIETEVLPLQEVLTEALSRLEPQLEEAGAHVEIRRPLCAVVGHRAVLSQAVTHLLSNAVKFMARGTQPQVQVGCEEPRPGWCRFTVRDNGIGIEPRYRERIFRVFERLHGLAEYPGAGLGLAIVRRAAERLGGAVGFESTPGEGSLFWIDLPKGDERA